MEEAKRRIKVALDNPTPGPQDWSAVKTKVRDVMGKFLYEKTRRRPMILPIIMDI